jgi:oligosaccharide repeat unit polymerase
VIFSDPGSVYLARTSNEMSALPYLGSLIYAACCLSGIYLARTGSLGIGVLPIALIALQHFFAMGRTGLGVAAMLFLVPYLYSSRVAVTWTKRKKVTVLAATCLLVACFAAVSLTRNLQVDFAGTTPELEDISEYTPVFPSLYSNFSATPVAFSIYLGSPDKQGMFGQYTFAPLFRLAASIGFQTSVPPYEENYYTPVPMNTSTYLKNAYSDFGLPGIFLFPFVLGFAVTGLLRFKDNPTCLVIAAHFVAVVAFSIFYNIMLSGDWYLSLFTSVLASRLIALVNSNAGKPGEAVVCSS